MPKDNKIVMEEVEQFMSTAPLYRQGAGGCFFFTATAFDTCLDIIPGLSVGYIGHDELDFVFHRGHMTAAARKILDAITSRESEITPLRREWRERKAFHDEYAENIRTAHLETVGRDALLTELGHYQKVIQYIWEGSFIIDCFDPDGHTVLEEEVFAHHLELLPTERELLVRHHLPTTPMRLEQAVLRGLLNASAHLSAELQHDFHWMNNDYIQAIELPVKHFVSVIEEVQKQHPSVADQEKRLREIEQWNANVMAEKEKLFQKYQLTPREQGIVLAFADLTDWREERKRQTQLSNWVLQQFMNALSQEFGLSIELLRCLDPRDTTLLLSPNVEERLSHRREHGVLQIYNGDTHTSVTLDYPEAIRAFKEAKAAVFADASRELKGQIAMKGHVTGVVKLVNSTKDFAKFEAGDILVSAMTRPELMPVIRKAGGIITDEGGITCHAALISRELKIPCVTGTQQATSVLRDGDRVELDADSGVVRKI